MNMLMAVLSYETGMKLNVNFLVFSNCALNKWSACCDY